MGVSPTGIPHTFQYLDHDTVYHGVMAQDLQLLAPEALVTREDGMFAVHYDLIDVDFMSSPNRCLKYYIQRQSAVISRGASPL